MADRRVEGAALDTMDTQFSSILSIAGEYYKDGPITYERADMLMREIREVVDWYAQEKARRA